MEISQSSGNSNTSVDSSNGLVGGRGDRCPPSVNGGAARNRNQETIGPEVKKIYRSLYIVVKQLDMDRKQLTCISQLFDNELERKRSQLIQLCKQIMFKDFQTIGKRAREIMWRKGYYEFIAFAKRNWAKEAKDPVLALELGINIKKFERLLVAGISNYKRLATMIEKIFDLDLKNLIDFTIIREDIDAGGELRKLESSGDREGIEAVTFGQDKSMEAVSFALDTIHSSILSLGDLHRYFIDFRIDTDPLITKDYVARYYLQAFKLNPTMGMAQNQLGTLYYSDNYDLDSIYHYMFSLVSLIPFELSESNVCKLLTVHADYLEKLDPLKIEFGLKDFYARFYLILDIFFFDKEVPDFNSLCHCGLVDLRKVLCSKTLKIEEESMFKIVSTLFFCLSKLKMINSPKVYSLNAFLLAVCSDLMDACIVNFEQTVLAKADQIEQFAKMYETKFEEFDMMVRKSRNEYKNWLVNTDENTNEPGSDKVNAKTSQILKDRSSDSRESQTSHKDYTMKPLNGVVDTHHQDSGDKSMDPISTRSSDEAKESDLKTPLSCKSKKRGMKLRRRRRKIEQTDESSCYDSESDMDTDFFSDEEDYTDLSTNFDTDFSDVDAYQNIDEREEKAKRGKCAKAGDSNETLPSHPDVYPTFSDNEDIVIEEERILSPQELLLLKKQQQQLQQQQMQESSLIGHGSQEIDSEELLHSFEVLHFTCGGGQTANLNVTDNKDRIPPKDILMTVTKPPKKLMYRNKYSKLDPNIVIEFARTEPTIRALKLLFDWLRINHEILFSCYHSNPEFIHKIIKLLNYLNIDIFTRKFFFEREFLTIPNIRVGLNELFDIRSNIPCTEDILFKNFDIFQSSQIALDWEATLRDKITPEEESVLRVLKMVDFGFFICKQKKFNYRFCANTRRFIESIKKKREEIKSSSRRRERRTPKNAARKRCEGRTRRYSDRRNGIIRKSYTSNEEKDTVEECRKQAPLRKGHLRNRNAEKLAEVSGGGGGDGTASTTTNSAIFDKSMLLSSSGADEDRSDNITKKNEIMCKLWLTDTVKSLEEELRKKPFSMTLTPFIVIDAKALTEYTTIVKNLIKLKDFIVLIPNAVLNELDELKKRSENARNVIRWLEVEFRQGNRFLRAQRDNEVLPLPLFKVPRKLDRESAVFMKIVSFCNHIVTQHTNPNADPESNIVTFLSGDTLADRQRNVSHNLSFAGILDSIPVQYDQISRFYSKFKVIKT